MASWQSYVDSLINSGKVTKAAIVGQNSDVLATSDGFQLSSSEQKVVAVIYQNIDHAKASGCILGGEKYFCLQADPRTINLKKGANGAVLVKTRQAILVALYESPVQGQEASLVVEGLADYLINQEL